jgi:hypothetical protein
METANCPERPLAPADGGPCVDLDERRTLAQPIVDTMREPLLVLDRHLRVVTANRSFYWIRTGGALRARCIKLGRTLGARPQTLDQARRAHGHPYGSGCDGK